MPFFLIFFFRASTREGATRHGDSRRVRREAKPTLARRGSHQTLRELLLRPARGTVGEDQDHRGEALATNNPK